MHNKTQIEGGALLAHTPTTKLNLTTLNRNKKKIIQKSDSISSLINY